MSMRSRTSGEPYERKTNAFIAFSSFATSRIVIEQAKGKISERDGVDPAEAFNRLRNHARNNNLRLTAVAEAAIAGTLLI